MKTLTILSSVALILATLPGTAQNNSGNDVFASVNSAHPVSRERASDALRRDKVGAELLPTRSTTDHMTREVRTVAIGFEVRVTAADGTVRMTGTYSDEKLTVANGPFTYYHDNGRVESEGSFVHGLKKGVWQRYDRDGNRLSEKVYSGESYEEMAVKYGWKKAAKVR